MNKKIRSFLLLLALIAASLNVVGCKLIDDTRESAQRSVDCALNIAGPDTECPEK